MLSTILLIIVTLFLPPVGVFIVGGCGADLLINICLTILGYFPGHIHAYYLEYVYYKRREESAEGVYDNQPAPGVYSSNIQTGGRGYANWMCCGTQGSEASDIEMQRMTTKQNDEPSPSQPARQTTQQQGPSATSLPPPVDARSLQPIPSTLNNFSTGSKASNAVRERGPGEDSVNSQPAMLIGATVEPNVMNSAYPQQDIDHERWWHKGMEKRAKHLQSIDAIVHKRTDSKRV